MRQYDNCVERQVRCNIEGLSGVNSLIFHITNVGNTLVLASRTLDKELNVQTGRIILHWRRWR